jgi:hypothetical protein
MKVIWSTAEVPGEKKEGNRNIKRDAGTGEEATIENKRQ